MNEQQIEEIEILDSIYGNDAIIQRYDHDMTLIVDIKILSNVIIRVQLESTYPSETGPKIELIGRDIPNDLKDSAYQYFREYYQQHVGEVVLFDCIEWVKENLQIQHPNQNQQTQRVVTPIEELVSYGEDDVPREGYDDIYHGETLIDRKSVFQAHVAAIASVEEAMNVLAILKSDRKIARATHNMYAYRIILPSTLPNGEAIHIADNDDDGEDAAGPKLAQLLSLMNAENLIVVVSRWYGGIQLGPDRFRHIANVARIAIEESGFGRTESEKLSKSSHKKSRKKR